MTPLHSSIVPVPHREVTALFGSAVASRKRGLPRLLSIPLKIFQIAAAFILVSRALSSAEEPSLSVYAVLREELRTGDPREAILKISNPPGKTYYVLGASMTDIPYVIEVQWNGKWVALPQLHDLSGAKMRPFLSDSYLLFSVIPPDSMGVSSEDLTFRVRVFLYTDPAFTNPYVDLTRKPFIEVVSEPMSGKDFMQEPASR